jgi:hypothetical protein
MSQKTLDQSLCLHRLRAEYGLEAILSQQEALERLGCTYHRLWRCMRDGFVQPIKMHGFNFYKTTDIDALSDILGNTAPQKDNA